MKLRLRTLLAWSLSSSLLCVALGVRAQATPTSAPPPPPPPFVPADPNAAPAPATAAQPPTPAASATVTVTAEAVLGFLQREAARGAGSCAISTTYRVGDRIAIACGPRGVWIAQLNPDGSLSPLSQQHFGVSVMRLFEGGGRLWAELERGGAVPIDPNATAATAATTTPAYMPPPAQRPLTPTPTTSANTNLPALPNDVPQGSALTRPRKGGFFEATGMIRPFLALETLGGGVLLDGTVGYRFEAPVHLWLSLQPFGPATGPDGSVSPFVLLALASFDTRNFELGLGFGAQTVNDTENDFGVDNRPIEAGTGITIAQFARLGERDSTMVMIRTDITLFHQKFVPANLFIHGQLPLRNDNEVWLIANIGYGITGYALGEIGLRNRLSGDGGPGTWFVDVTVGGTSLFWTDPLPCNGTDSFDCFAARDYSGPLLGIGFESRL